MTVTSAIFAVGVLCAAVLQAQAGSSLTSLDTTAAINTSHSWPSTHIRSDSHTVSGSKTLIADYIAQGIGGTSKPASSSSTIRAPLVASTSSAASTRSDVRNSTGLGDYVCQAVRCTREDASIVFTQSETLAFPSSPSNISTSYPLSTSSSYVPISSNTTQRLDQLPWPTNALATAGLRSWTASTT